MKKKGLFAIIAVVLVIIIAIALFYLRVPSYSTYDSSLELGDLSGIEISEDLQSVTEYFVDEQIKFEIIDAENYICSYYKDNSDVFLLVKRLDDYSGYRVDIASDVDLTTVSKSVLREILKDSQIAKYSWKY